MRHAVFGASTVVGSALVRRLHAAGEEVLAYDLQATPEAGGPVAVHRCDPDRDLREPAHFFGVQRIDVGYWLVRSPPFGRFPQGSGRLIGVNVAGPVRVAEAVLAAGARVMIHAASGSMYAPSWDPIPEAADFQHHNPYALSAIAGENALELVHVGRPDFNIVYTRLFGVFGWGQARGLVPGLARRIRQGESVELAPHPESGGDDHEGLRLSLTYAEDAAAILVGLVERALGGAEMARFFNVASPEPVSTRRLAEVVGKTIEVEPSFAVTERPRAGDLVASVDRLRQTMDIPATCLEVALDRTLASIPEET